MAFSKKEIGAWGEAVARRFLEQRGYLITEKNFRTRFGEIDIIAWQKDTDGAWVLCFIEVKTRGKKDGSAERSVGRGKLLNARHAAIVFCISRHIDISETPIRFEHVRILPGPGVGSGQGKRARVRHLIIDPPPLA